MSHHEQADYDLLRRQLLALLDGETDKLANTANLCALLYDQLDRVNWVGVYVVRDRELVLGPFQGKPACVRIPIGQGVCGTAAMRRQTMRVPDVHAFAGHIACDAASKSELVVPLLVEDCLVGVLDLDSPVYDRFGPVDQTGIEALCAIFTATLGSAGDRFI